MDAAAGQAARRVREEGLRTFGGGVVLVGGAAGWFVLDGVRWLLSLQWVPMRGPLRLVEQVIGDLPSPVTAAVGALLGAALAAMAWADRHELAVDDAEVVLRRGSSRLAVPRRAVTEAFVDGTALVLTSSSGVEVLREATRLPGTGVERALRAAGLRWHEADPHLADFVAWAPGSAADAAVDALLVARRQALDADRQDDAGVLREALWGLGVVVRDEGTRQWWRAVRPPQRPADPSSP